MYWKSNPRLYPSYLRAWIKRGKGVGAGLNYRPWLHVRDVPSEGTSAQIGGIIHRRAHHLLSERETMYFMLIERRKHTVDIRECWPIFDIARTLELCSALGVRHQYREGFPTPFTIDFLITESVGGQLIHRAASIKTPEDAANPATRRRLEIENRWCIENGISWTLVDTSLFDQSLLSTLHFMRTWFRHRYIPDAYLEDVFMKRFSVAYARNIPLGDLIKASCKALRLPIELGTDMFRYCAWQDNIPVSLEHALALNKPLVLRGEGK